VQVLGSDAALTLEMVDTWLEGAPKMPSELKIHLIVTCYHKMLRPDMSRDLLSRLSVQDRSVAESKLGHVSFSFTKNNPTGYYRMNLDNPTEREVALRLCEISNEQVNPKP